MRFKKWDIHFRRLKNSQQSLQYDYQPNGIIMEHDRVSCVMRRDAAYQKSIRGQLGRLRLPICGWRFGVCHVEDPFLPLFSFFPKNQNQSITKPYAYAYEYELLFLYYALNELLLIFYKVAFSVVNDYLYVAINYLCVRWLLIIAAIPYLFFYSDFRWSEKRIVARKKQ